MFVDKLKIQVEAGHGGSGSISFRREKYIPMGGPDGGDGGNGGSVFLVASSGEQSLIDLKYQSFWKAERGGNGAGRRLHGANGADVRIKVPVGTLVFDVNTDELLCDLKEDGQVFCAAQGGKGGLGNIHFVSSVNRAPRKAQPGLDGEARELELELKTVADVGLVGFPNAGKSTLLTAVSAAHPKTAPYPFTTLTPNIGVIETDDYRRFTMADIPGLIEGAHGNVGLGHDFLRHIERCRIFCYVLDMAGTDGRDPLDDLKQLRLELDCYEPGLSGRPFVIAANKIDVAESAANLERLRQAEPAAVILPICAELSENTQGLIDCLRKMLDTLPPEDPEALQRLLARRRKTSYSSLEDDDDQEMEDEF